MVEVLDVGEVNDQRVPLRPNQLLSVRYIQKLAVWILKPVRKNCTLLLFCAVVWLQQATASCLMVLRVPRLTLFDNLLFQEFEK